MRAVWVVLALVVIAATARADDAADALARAREYLAIGKQAMDQKQYEVAITAFEETYRLTPKPTAAYALAIAYKFQWEADQDPSKLKRAVSLFREVLAQPDDAKKPKHARTREYLASLEPALAELEAKQAAEGGGPIAEAKAQTKTALILSSKVPGTRFRFDDETQPRTPPVVIETTAGPHRIAAYADGYYTTSQTVEALPGESLPVDLVLEPRPAVVTVRSDDDAEVAIDGVRAGRTNQEIEVPAGEHRIEVRRAGRHVWSQQLHFEMAEEVRIDADLRKTRKRQSIVWVAAASGLLLIGGGAAAAVAWDAQGEAEAFERDRRSGVELYPEDLVGYDDDIDRRNRWRIVAGWTLGAAGAGLLGVAYLYFTDEPPPIGVGLIAGGATGTVAWTW